MRIRTRRWVGSGYIHGERDVHECEVEDSPDLWGGRISERSASAGVGLEMEMEQMDEIGCRGWLNSDLGEWDVDDNELLGVDDAEETVGK